jgi:phenylacetate-CoA ligase
MAAPERQSESAAALHRVAQSPAGRQILLDAGVDEPAAAGYDDFLRLPVLDRSRVAEFQLRYPEAAGFSTIPLAEFGRLGLHAGGELDVSYAGREGADVMAGLFAELGVHDGDVVVNTFGYHMSTVAHVFDDGLRRLGACVVSAGPGNAELQLQLIKRVGATVWLGFPSFLWRMLTQDPDAAAKSLRLAILGGEFAPRIRAELESQFGIASREFYGVSILGPAAFECEAREGMHVADDMVFEIVDVGTGMPVGDGEAGQIVLTPLRNEYVIPRLGTGDLSRWLPEPCSCGRTSPRIEGILGRVGEGVKVRGVFLYPRDVRAVREALPGVSHARLTVGRSLGAQARDELTLAVVFEPGASMPDGFDALVADAFQAQCRVRLDAVETLEAPADDRVLVDVRDWEVGAS